MVTICTLFFRRHGGGDIRGAWVSHLALLADPGMHHSLINDRPRSEAETDAEQAKSDDLQSPLVRWGSWCLLSLHRIHDRGPSRPLISSDEGS